MTNNEMYESICKMLQEYDVHTGSRGADGVALHPEKWVDCDYLPFYADAAKMLISIREKLDTAVTPQKAINALKRIIKINRLQGVFEFGGYYCACNGYVGVRLHNDVSSLPHLEKGIDMDKIFADPAIASETAMELPSVAALKAAISAARAKDGKKARCVYLLPCGSVVNASYLVDVLEALPGCTAFVPSGDLAPVYFRSSAGDAILLPIQPKVKKDGGYYAADGYHPKVDASAA